MSLALPLPVGSPPSDEDLDAETSGLIAKLVLEDLEEVFASQKGKSRFDAPLSDEEYAYKLQEQYFKDLLIVAEDDKYARSLDAALATDTPHLEAWRVAEEAAEQDRRVAQMVERGEALPPPTATQARLEHPAFVMHPEPPNLSPRISKKGPENRTYSADDVRLEDYHTLTSEKALQYSAFDPHSPGSGPSIDRHKTISCVSCDESFSSGDTLHAPCDHYYCRNCLTTLVDLFTRDESLFPLRCCKRSIPPRDVAPFLATQLCTEFERKHFEFSVLSKDRIYCAQPTCSTFLGSSEGVNGTGVACPDCLQSTCHRCKQAEHGKEDCVVNAATVAIRALAREKGWQTCPGCHTLVELDMGCYHMTCRCQTQFCYVCAVIWKGCQCPQWEENRLLAAAREREENQIGAQAIRNMAPAVLQDRVQQRVRRLRVDHDCNQHRWRYRSGGGQCNECRKTLESYLLVCRNCAFLACVRCTRNRL